MTNKVLISLKEMTLLRLNEKNWSERDLAKACGVTPATINRFLKDEKRDAAFSIVANIIDELDLPVTMLFGAKPNVDISSQSTIATLMETVNNLNKRIRELEEKAIEPRQAIKANSPGLNKP